MKESISYRKYEYNLLDFRHIIFNQKIKEEEIVR